MYSKFGICVILIIGCGVILVASAPNGHREKRTIHLFLQHFMDSFAGKKSGTKTAKPTQPPPPPPPPTQPPLPPPQNLFGLDKFNFLITPFNKFANVPTLKNQMFPGQPLFEPSKFMLPFSLTPPTASPSSPAPSTQPPPTTTTFSASYTEAPSTTPAPTEAPSTEAPATTQPPTDEPQSTLPPLPETTLPSSDAPSSPNSEPKVDINAQNSGENTIQNAIPNEGNFYSQYFGNNPIIVPSADYSDDTNYQYNGIDNLDNRFYLPSPPQYNVQRQYIYEHAPPAAVGHQQSHQQAYVQPILPPSYYSSFARQAAIPQMISDNSAPTVTAQPPTTQSHSSVKMHDSNINYFTYHSGEIQPSASQQQQIVTGGTSHGSQFYGKRSVY